MGAINVNVGSSQIAIATENFKHTQQLLQRFTQCAAAKDFLENVAANLNIFLQTGDFDRSNVEEGDASDSRIISISKTPRTKNEDTEVTSLAFELFNGKNMRNFRALGDLAAEGEVGMDAYATQKDSLEADAELGRLDLKNTCAKAWKIRKPNDNPFSIDAQIKSVKDVVWKGEWMCHADAYREEWIDTYKSRYCKKHPEDKASCKASKKKLCYAEYQSLEPQEKRPYLMQRLCREFFNNAPDHIKPVLEPMVKQACPDVLKKSKKVPASTFGLDL